MKKIKVEWFIIGILIIIISAGSMFLYNTMTKNTPEIEEEIVEVPEIDTTGMSLEERMLFEYEQLENAYNKTLLEIETTISDENMSVDILKQNLTQILENIKAEKESILAGEAIEIDMTQTQQYSDLLDMSKDVLAERILEMQNENQKLSIDNRKLSLNLEKATEYFEVEKSKNTKLNEIVSNVNAKIDQLEKEGATSSTEMKILKRERVQYIERLEESNRIINTQEEQITDLGEILRKVNVDCFFYYEQGNADDEALIYLTQKGISERYLKYFIRRKPNLFIRFRINQDLFEETGEKVDLIVFNAQNVEIYSTAKTIRGDLVAIEIPNNKFRTGKYSLELRVGEENLIVNDRYYFNITQ